MTVHDLTERRKAHRKPRRDEPNERVQRVRADLGEIASRVTIALDQVHTELSCIGQTGTTTGERVSGGSASKSPTARQAERATDLKAWRDDLRDAIRDLERARDTIRSLASRHQPAEAPAYIAATLCGDAYHGRPGVAEWGKPHPSNPNRSRCVELPVSSGLCSRCYQAERKWRKEAGLEDRAERSEGRA